MSNDRAPLFSVETYKLEDGIGFWLTRARTTLVKSVDDALTVHDITHAQGLILLKLMFNKFDTAADLAREICIDAAAMKRMIDRLVSRGLIERVPSEQDRRVIKLHLTGEGRELAKEMPAILVGVLNKILSNFSAEEAGFLKSLLKKLVESNGHRIEPTQ